MKGKRKEKKKGESFSLSLSLSALRQFERLLIEKQGVEDETSS